MLGRTTVIAIMLNHVASLLATFESSWFNFLHLNFFRHAGLEVKHYKYYNPETRGLDINGMLGDLKVRWKHFFYVYVPHRVSCLR